MLEKKESTTREFAVGHQRRRSSGRAADPFRAGHQSQDREGDRPRSSRWPRAARGQGDRVKRREFITLLGGAATAWPLAARAQQPMPVIGLLSSVPFETRRDQVLGFHRGLKESGYVEGQNVAIEYRSADNQIDRLPALAADLVNRRVDVIVTIGGDISIHAAKAATTPIPVVFVTGFDSSHFMQISSSGWPNWAIKKVGTLHSITSKHRISKATKRTIAS